ncbi:MAG: glycosyltransferase [Brevinema sp.]
MATHKKICTCDRCSEGTYNPNDYIVIEADFKQLDKERPFGISGHLRAKNEGLTLSACIESCIHFLDELIITYNDSEDDTEEICQYFAEKYPDKIKLYHYKPFVMPGTYVEKSKSGSFDISLFRESKSIHNGANYYNFGYVRISYAYYMKIDGDQIYFHKKLMNIKKD